jgi:hypothetical protein
VFTPTFFVRLNEVKENRMFKVNVMYPYSEGARFDHAYYRDRHMPMVKARLGSACAYYTVEKGPGPQSARCTARLRGDVRVHL